MNEILFEDIKGNSVLVDVRSPMEYKDGAIYGATNIPILNDEERKIVGTAYKQQSKNHARRIGLELVGNKLVGFFDSIIELKKNYPYVICYCARGGYRSTAFVSIFSAIGVNLFKLTGGYKYYRNYLLDSLPKLCEEKEFIVLHGNTGVGKTEILHCLKEKGMDVLDLEGAANHRGSLLGSIGLGQCSTQKNFESSLLYQFQNMNSKYVFVEAESQQIGKSLVPKYIYNKMKAGKHIFIEADIDYRVKVLKREYTVNDNWKEESAVAIENFRKYISNNKVEFLKEIIFEGNFEQVAKELMINYYDPMYMHKTKEYEYNAVFRAESNSDDVAEQIKQWLG